MHCFHIYESKFVSRYQNARTNVIGKEIACDTLLLVFTKESHYHHLKQRPIIYSTIGRNKQEKKYLSLELYLEISTCEWQEKLCTSNYL